MSLARLSSVVFVSYQRVDEYQLWVYHSSVFFCCSFGGVLRFLGHTQTQTRGRTPLNQ